ncbi:MAG: ATP synthase subunit I [Desulfarculaceae bacterium]|nr:ATP synthase subunit I [Desulfarculaceae bacterium]MCF8073702.1 ATP synthase subunit I [Desulfarculaceae bacterium]MCF8101943.1 ATP synthase subunit I [Desulfarculaceae bacterium]MCF8115913.1 ATP synthase subunit I [Desulfarculaceae bacterium]
MDATARNTEGPTGAFVKQVITRALLFAVAAALILTLTGQSDWARGVALGAIASVANFLVMAWLLPRALDPARRRGQAFTVVSVVLRFALMAAALAVALSMPARVAPLAVAAGLFMVQFTLLSDRFMGGRLVGSPSESK